MFHRWHDAEALLVDAATEDLWEVGEVQPALIAFAGAMLRFVAWLRPFPGGGHHQPLIELLALAGPLDCDRLMLSLGGRLWRLDRAPPLAAREDQRQRAIVVHAVDGAGGAPRAWSALYPFTLDTRGMPTLEPRRDPGAAQGWLGTALLAAVCHRERLRAPWEAIAEQIARVDALGHVLYLPPDVVALLAGTRAPGC